MLIEIKGVQFSNKGAELMLEAILEQLSTRFPDAQIALQPGRFSPYSKRAMVPAFQRLNLRKNRLDLNGITYYLPAFIRRGLKEFGIVTEADVDVILDASGFSYGDQWPYFVHYHAASEAARMKKKGKKFILLPQALGPFESKTTAKQMTKLLENASLTFARDDVSYRHASQLTTHNLHQAPDFTNLLKPKNLATDEKFASSVCLIPNSKMLSTKNSNALWHKRYLEFWHDIVEVLAEAGYGCFLLNHEGDEDLEICQRIAAHSSQPIEIIQEPSPTRVKALIGESAFAVCSRFHGCVSGLSQGKVVFGTSWAHKYEQLYKDYDASSLLLSPEQSKADLKKLIQETDFEKVSTTLLQRSCALKQQAQTMWNNVANELCK
ncbi:polysaccharide pyruvyl transferase family protein [Aliagarivorans taiwanensis]|uniref:polysaccharide pyruvyl transferase family protein n=1 Tax=Aliagarivorans taiwanensis TaxID=561966 RepID=UPI000419695F|nr:polysaccharide pyruvyl transferase family protein [Aliagarivorans taiwanensis]